MRWWVLWFAIACGSSERTPSPTTETATVQATMHATMEATMEAAANVAESTMQPSMQAVPTAPPEPTEVPAELRESHDRLLARVESDASDIASLCSLASVLRRAGMYRAADGRLDDAFRITTNALLGADLDVPPGTIEACHYERGQVAEARADLAVARDAYWEAMKTPIERRRRIVRDAFFRVAKLEVEADCGAMSTLALRSLLSLNDELVFRRCLREQEQVETTCPILRLDDPDYPGTQPDDFLAHTPVIGVEGAGFGIIDEELYVISVIRGRKQVRRCNFDVPRDSMIGPAFVHTLGDTTLYVVSTTHVTSYSCECEEGEEGHPESPSDCRCEDAFDIRFVFTDRGELRLALIQDYSIADMAGVSWDVPHIRESMSHPASVVGDVLRTGRELRLRSHALVPAR